MHGAVHHTDGSRKQFCEYSTLKHFIE
jgi:hypothetical protein